jgi:hypothetical protein
MNLKEAKQFATSYRKILRQIKRRGLDLNEAPQEVQQSALALHQNALLVEKIERELGAQKS